MAATTLEASKAPPVIAELPERIEVDTCKLFDVLTAHWKSDLRAQASSDPIAILKNPAFQMMLGMGPGILRLIFREYAQDEKCADWELALSSILKFSPVPEEHFGRLKLAREDWLAWGRAHGYL